MTQPTLRLSLFLRWYALSRLSGRPICRNPRPGSLKLAIRSLAAKTWTHPVSGRDVCFAAVTIERWYYKARREKDDPVAVLRRVVRKDCGTVSLAAEFDERLLLQYRDHKHWSYQL